LIRTGQAVLSRGHVVGVQLPDRQQKFDPNRIDPRVGLGTVEEWTIVNMHTDDHAAS
jgi:FtsP/CotA-like multicopper oxidase with cupredoxin domain